MYTKFEKCITCHKIGVSCVPNLMLLPFEDLLVWWDKRQKYLEWSKQDLADRSNVPIGTIKRIKAGEHPDCRYSTIKSILITLIGGTTDEFACSDRLESDLKEIERLKEHADKLSFVEQENAELKETLRHIEEKNRADIRAIREEYREQIAFLKDQLKAWQTVNEKKGV